MAKLFVQVLIKDLVASSEEVQIDLNDVRNSLNEEGTGILPPTGTIPSQEDYSGPYGFELNLTSSSHGRGSYVYSPLLKQVFIGMNNVLMMEFKTTLELHAGLYIRSLLVYTCDDFVCEPVVRCASHALEDDPRQEAHARGEEEICRCANFKQVGHVMRCSLSDAEYCYDSRSERHSVRVPVGKLQAGTDFIQIPYSFSCKTSCPRGMQRKPVQIVFTLENEEGYVFGRKVLPVKICSCPKRDKDRQERDYRKAQQLSCPPSGSKRLASAPTNQNEAQQPPPLKAIKLEENHFDESILPNDVEKVKHNQRQTVDDNYNRLLTKLTNIENTMGQYEKTQDRIEKTQDRIEKTQDRILSLLTKILETRT
ncbi:hypothetical protein O3M35_013115 [Rhynocoris fuscipes]|uniref:p53 DNA-binding domain-containing protein n=1 Tax=Rhynocoris fuscipes TaxID=488301 RepID=A0AAW1CK68_9HEMI